MVEDGTRGREALGLLGTRHEALHMMLKGEPDGVGDGQGFKQRS